MKKGVPSIIDVQWYDHPGQTALHEAVAFGRPELVQLLEDHGADATIKSYPWQGGRTTLECAEFLGGGFFKMNLAST